MRPTKIKDLDPRFLQLSIQIIIVLFGLFLGAFYLPWQNVLGYGILFLLFFLGQNLKGLQYHLSNVLSLFSLFILVRVDSFLMAFFLGFLALSSKRFFRYKEKHIFNPSNFAVVLGLLFFSQHVWISPGQWGQLSLLFLGVVLFGFFINKQIQRLELPFCFIFFFFLFYFVRNLILGDPLNIIFHHFSQTSLIIFTFLTMTDPKTTPNSFFGRIGFGFFVSLLAFIMETQFFMRGALFYSLFLANLITPIIDTYSKTSRFKWKNSSLA